MKVQPNPGKKLEMTIEDQNYLRIPIRTKMINPTDDIVQVVQEYAGGQLQQGDFIVISEKVVAITQGRSYRLEDINPSALAKFLSKFVHKSPHGLGLGTPWSMQLAIQEAGALRIIFASIVGAIGKLFGIRGLFYRICGHKVRSIDGPCDYTIPPYDVCVVLGPENPHLVAKSIKDAVGCGAAIIDANDLGVNILGVSGPEVDVALLEKLLQDNPLGQSSEQTPLGIIRLSEEQAEVDLAVAQVD